MHDKIAMIEVTATSFSDQVIEKSREIPVLVDFWAAWCAPCKMLMPVLETIASEYSEKLCLVKVNTDQEPSLATDHGVRSLPTVKLFKDGESVDQFMGALSEQAVKEFVERYLDRPADLDIRTAAELSAAGRQTEAISVLTAALTQEPNYDKTRLALAEVQLDCGHMDDARQTLSEVSDRIRFDPPFKSLSARLELVKTAGTDVTRSELEQRVIEDPTDLPARQQLGAQYFTAGESEAAMEQWLEIVRVGRGDPQEKARSNLLRIFEILGSTDEHVIRYRRLLSQMLN